MSLRALAFGVRLNDKGRSLRVHANARKPGHYTVEESRKGGKTSSRDHGSLASALRDAAASWRKRLN